MGRFPCSRCSLLATAQFLNQPTQPTLPDSCTSASPTLSRQHMDLEGTDIHPDRIESINAQLQVNQEMLAAACKEAGKKVPKEARVGTKAALEAVEGAAAATTAAAP